MTRAAPVRRGRACAAAAVALALAAAPAGARTVEVPLALDGAFLRAQLEARIFSENRTAGVRGADRCSEGTLALPALRFLPPGRVELRSDARARVGIALGGRCLGLRDREGVLSVTEEPWLEPGGATVHFRVVASRLAPEAGSWLPEERLWGWVEPALRPRLEAFSVDLAPLLDDLRLLLPLFAPRSAQGAAERLAASLALGGVRVGEDGVRVVLRFDVDEAPPRRAEPEPPLTAAERAAFHRELRRFDAFLTFVVKQAGRDAAAPARRQELLAVLLDARYALLDALESDGAGRDPVRVLFVASWARLAPVLRSLDDELPPESGLRYLAFVAAGDALAALDAAGPAFGLELSRDGLRRLARTIAPAAAGDPLARPRAVDPELRGLFGFGAPLPPPVLEEGAGPSERAPSERAPGEAPPRGAPSSEGAPSGAAPGAGGPGETPPAAGEPGATPPRDALPGAAPPSAAPPGPAPLSDGRPDEPGPGPAPPDVEPPAEPPPDAPPAGAPPPAVAPGGESDASAPGAGASRALERFARALGALLSAPAWAEPAAPDDPSLRVLARRVGAWAPTYADARDYVPLAGRLLRRVAEEAHAASPLPGEREPFFRTLVLATGWQESCWRQVVRRGDRVVPLRSSAGAVGIMQVSERVWRGFYDVDGLRRDAAYNGRAGSEILLHYLRDFALPRERELGGTDALARASYAMYNGGPGHALRWRDPKTAPALRAIDAAFLQKYQAMRAGDDGAVLSCFAG